MMNTDKIKDLFLKLKEAIKKMDDNEGLMVCIKDSENKDFLLKLNNSINIESLTFITTIEKQEKLKV